MELDRMKKFFGVAMTVAMIFGFSACDQNPGSVSSNSPSNSPIVSATAAKPTLTPPAHDKYSVEWIRNDIPQTMNAGILVTVHVTAKNTGDWTWPDPKAANPSSPDGTYAVRLAYRWAELEAGAPERGELAGSVAPGQTADFTISIIPPKEPGSYHLHVSLVQELAVSFSDKGVADLVVPVTVH